MIVLIYKQEASLGKKKKIGSLVIYMMTIRACLWEVKLQVSCFLLFAKMSLSPAVSFCCF